VYNKMCGMGEVVGEDGAFSGGKRTKIKCRQKGGRAAVEGGAVGLYLSTAILRSSS
jgi:hypothetical protein